MNVSLTFADESRVAWTCRVNVATESDPTPREVARFDPAFVGRVSLPQTSSALLAEVFPTEETAPGQSVSAPDFDGRLDVHALPEYTKQLGELTLKGVKLSLRHVFGRQIVGGAKAVFALDRAVPPTLSFMTAAGRLIEVQINCSER